MNRNIVNVLAIQKKIVESCTTKRNQARNRRTFSSVAGNLKPISLAPVCASRKGFISMGIRAPMPMFLSRR